MPTYDFLPRFLREFNRLTPQQRAAFLTAVAKLVQDLPTGHVRAGLRIKPVAEFREIFEMTWAPDGRATFTYGDAVRPGHTHIIWRRIGTHDIFAEP